MKAINYTLLTAILLLQNFSVSAGSVTIPNTFTSGTPAVASDVNDNFTAVKAAVNDNDSRITINEGDISTNDGRITSLESAPASSSFSDFFTIGTAQTTQECANWNKFRAGLQPSKYTCVQITSSIGKGLTSCDPSIVTEIATAVRDNTAADVTIGTDNWRVGICGGATSVELSANPGSASICSCIMQATVRPCIDNDTSNSSWGGVGGNSCIAPSQELRVNFR